MPRWRNFAPAGALVGVFLLKLLVVFELRDHPLLQPEAGLDTGAYVDLARQVAAGNLGLGPGLYYVSPLYIYFLAAIIAVTGSVDAARLVQVALGTATIAMIFVMAREWFGRRAAWVAGAMASLCGVLTFYEALLLQSSLDAFLTAAALASLTFALRRDSTRWWVTAGVIFGLATLNRPNMLLPAVAIAVILLALKRVRPAIVLAAGIVIGLAPVAIRNIVVSGQWSLVSSHGGLNFFIGNNATATGLYQIVPGVRPEIEGQREDTRKVAEQATGRRMSDSEVSDYFFDLGWSWIREQPVGAMRLLAKKYFLAFHADHVALPQSFLFFAWDAKTTMRWMAVNAWLIFPLGLLGLAFAAPGAKRTEYLVWASFVPLYAAAVAVFFVAERYRLPLFVPLCIGAGAAIDRAWEWIADRRAAGRRPVSRIALIAVATFAIFAAVNWPVALADSREGDRLRMAVLAAKRGDFDAADRWIARAKSASTNIARVDEVTSRAFLEEGRSAAQRGAAGVAQAFFRRAVAIRPDLAEAWAQLGFSLLGANQPAEAERALGEAVRLDPRDTVALGGLAIAALNRGDIEAARKHATAALAIDPQETLALRVLAAIPKRF